MSKCSLFHRLDELLAFPFAYSADIYSVGCLENADKLSHVLILTLPNPKLGECL